MAVHGDITDISFNHPTLGQGYFAAKANEGNTYDTGGIRNTDDANMITGNGDPMWQKNRVMAFVEAVIEDDQNTQATADLIAQLAASPVPAVWTFSVINGTVWKITGKPVGDIQPDINAGTVTVKIAGGRLEKISG
jgi:hypothetical protein